MATSAAVKILRRGSKKVNFYWEIAFERFKLQKNSGGCAPWTPLRGSSLRSELFGLCPNRSALRAEREAKKGGGKTFAPPSAQFAPPLRGGRSCLNKQTT